MLFCFGISWPFSIYKSYKNKSVKGKSAIFLSLLLIGYAAGIINKWFYSFDRVIYLYALNFLLVFTDLMLYFRYRNNSN